MKTKFKIGDKVKIIQRKPDNKTGGVNWDLPNGDVGVICYVCENSPTKFILKENKDGTGTYYGMYCPNEKYYFNDDDLELVSEEFILPEKWCVALTEDNVETLEQWRNWKNKSLTQTAIYGYLLYNKVWFNNIPSDCKEITFEQFKEHVFKNSNMKISNYECLPFPKDKPYIKLRVTKDIVKKDISTGKNLPDIIPAGSITWAESSFFEDVISRLGNIHPENNRYSANIPAEYFEIIEECIDEPINTYGLQVGDKLPSAIISEWKRVGNNRCQINDGSWEKSSMPFHGDRTILSFKVLHGIIGFEVSGTVDVYLRAEGFKEFMESFNKPKFETGKWYKYNDWYLKLLRIREDNIFIASDTIWITENEYKDWSNQEFTCGQADKSKILLTDLSEIQPYLPDGHIDKVSMKKNEFKKGDYVVCLSEAKPAPKSFSHEKNGGNGFKANYCFKLDSANDYSEQQTLFPEKHVHGFWSDSVRYATPEEIAEYDRLGEPYNVTTLNIKKDDNGRPLKTFEVGKWYTNPCYPEINGVKYKYFRIKQVEQIKGYKSWYNKFVFDKVADENWNIIDIHKTQSNTNFDQEMRLVEQPQKSLVGRYVKCLRDGANCCAVNGESVKKGQYYQIESICEEEYKLKNGNYCGFVDKPESYFNDIGFELMPEGFTPESEVTEYYEFIGDSVSSFTNGKIYKCNNPLDFETYDNFIDNNGNPNGYSGMNYRKFKPSTKEAYLAQESQSKEPKNSSMKEIKVGDTVRVTKRHCDNDAYVGYVGKITELDLDSDVPYQVDYSWCTDVELVNTPKAYTAEEALAELKRRGFKKGCRYTYMYTSGDYDEKDTCEADDDVEIREGGHYIDCGRGYLWHKENPTHLHRGPISSPTNDYALTIDEVFTTEKPEEQLDYLKPETLLPQTTLNY